MGCFAIKIIIRNHILSFKKVLKKCENWQKKILILHYWKSVFLDIFCPLLTLLLVALENLVWAYGPEPTWSLKIGFGSKGIQNEKFIFFSPIFLTNRVWPNQAKSCKWVMFKTLLCQPAWFQMYVWYVIWKYT